jgi:hypothetical protein
MSGQTIHSLKHGRLEIAWRTGVDDLRDRLDTAWSTPMGSAGAIDAWHDEFKAATEPVYEPLTRYYGHRAIFKKVEMVGSLAPLAVGALSVLQAGASSGSLFVAGIGVALFLHSQWGLRESQEQIAALAMNRAEMLRSGERMAREKRQQLAAMTAPAPSQPTLGASAPAQPAVNPAPSQSAVNGAPSPSTVSAAPSQPTVSASPSPSTVSAVPSPSTVSASPSPSTVSAARSQSAVNAAPSPSTVSAAPSPSTVSASPSQPAVSASPSPSTVSASSPTLAGAFRPAGLSLVGADGKPKSSAAIGDELVASTDAALDSATACIGHDATRAAALADELRARTEDSVRSMMSTPFAKPDPHNGMTVLDFLSLGFSVGVAYATPSLARPQDAPKELPPMGPPTMKPGADVAEQTTGMIFDMGDRMALAMAVQMARGASPDAVKSQSEEQLRNYADLPGMAHDDDPADLAQTYLSAASLGAQLGAAYAATLHVAEAATTA